MVLDVGFVLAELSSSRLLLALPLQPLDVRAPEHPKATSGRNRGKNVCLGELANPIDAEAEFGRRTSRREEIFIPVSVSHESGCKALR